MALHEESRELLKTGEEAEIIAERIRRTVAAGVEKEVGIRTTVSLGITTIGPWDEQPHELIARADRALYEAKAAGRDCFRTVQPETDRGRNPRRIALVPAAHASRR